MKQFLYTILVCSWGITLSAQSDQVRQALNWHFGDEVAVSFIGGVPILNTPSAVKAQEGVVALSDTTGRLLFYTNGGGRPRLPNLPDDQQLSTGIIWNRNHEVMYDMRGEEGGGLSARQSALAFPDPGGETGVYYLFTVDENEFISRELPDEPRGRGLSYFIIDMALNGGLGGVRLADQRVIVPALEALDATPTADGTGYWVLSHQNSEDAPGFIRLLVDADGVSEPTTLPAVRSLGRLKFSPDGRYLLNDGILYSFDNETGIVASDPVELPGISSVAATFTPDSRFLYTIVDQPNIGEVIVRYNARDLTEAPLPVEILEIPGENAAVIASAPFQIGPNGNIYFVEQTVSRSDGAIGYALSEIVCVSTPNPTVNRRILELPQNNTVGLLAQNLPQYVDAIFIEPALPDTITFDTLAVTGCDNGPNLLEARETGTAYRWSTGDTTAQISVTTSGDYCVTITNDCRPTVDCQILTVTETTIDPVTFGTVDLGCEGQGCRIALNPGSPFNDIRATLFRVNPLGSPIPVRVYEFISDTLELVKPGDGESYEIVIDYGECGEETYPLPIAETNVLPQFTPDFQTQLGPEDDCPDRPVTLSVGADSGPEVASVRWFDGDTLNPRTFTTAVDAEYAVTAFSVCGDSATFVFAPEIREFCDCRGEVPELMTPNGDGINDVFQLYTNCPTENFTLVIYNRWGQKAFSSDDGQAAWDGTTNGKPQPTGMYTYFMQFQFPGIQETQIFEGSFMLVR